MIRIEDELHARYLGHNLNDCNHFEEWLKKLGLSQLIKEFSPYDFVKFGWIRPVLRVDIPESYYLTWKNYPERPADNPEFEDKLAFYCNPYSDLTLDDPPESWFLHIFDKPDSEAKEFLSHKVEEDRNIPQNKEHPRGHPRGLVKYNPCWLYFSHWQGYFLVDLARNIELVPSIPNIPNALEHLEFVQKKFSKLKRFSDSRIEAVKKKWDKHATFFKYISYYRTFLGLSLYYAYNWAPNERDRLRAEGRKELASFLNISPETLETGIEKHLLTVFQEWQWARQLGEIIYPGALEQLQKDIYYTVEWLCFLTGEKFDTYFEKWKYHGRSQREWAELRKALPFEYKKTKAHFLEIAPTYLTEILKNCPYMEKNQSISLINSLFQNYISFRRFCRAFHKLHDLLPVKNEIDFRDRDAFFDFFYSLPFELK